MWKKEVHFPQLEYNVQPSHINYGNDKESATNFEVSEGSLPFCFASFQFIRDNFHAIRNQLSTSFDLDHLEDNEILVQDLSYPDLQPPNAIDCQVLDEDLEAEPYDQMMQDVSVPFYFESFQFLKGNLHSISLNEQPVGNHVISSELVENGLQKSFQAFHDRIADVLDDVYIQSPSPLATCELEASIDTNLIRQPVSWSFLAGVSSQSSNQSLHSWYEEKRSNPLDELSPSVHELQDPYVVFLEADRESILFNGSVHKFSWELPFSSFLLLFISKHLQRNQTIARTLTWLHWFFYFT